MATFRICVFKHQRRQDGLFPVSIRVYWQKKIAYMKTDYYVSIDQINRKTYEIKDPEILKELMGRISRYERIKVSKLGERIYNYTAKELAEYLQKSYSGDNLGVDFIAFAQQGIAALFAADKQGTAFNYRATINNLIDFVGPGALMASEINYSFLKRFEAYLRTERKMYRMDRFGRIRPCKRAPLTDTGIVKEMSHIRKIFNDAIREFNDEDRGEIRISNYPFRKYKIEKQPESESRSLTVEQIRSIIALKPDKIPTVRGVLGRDVFILIFGLIGINMVDLFNLRKSDVQNGRIAYKRRKTQGRREDEALISIRIEPEIADLVEKYRDTSSAERFFTFSNRYRAKSGFIQSINDGLKVVASLCWIEAELSTYYARHSWATIARNDCGISMDDVAMSLNHLDVNHRTTDLYVRKDWSVIDRANRKVIDYVFVGSGFELTE